MPAKLLSLSSDLGLLLNRNQALATAGFSVSSPRSLADSTKLLETQPFAAVLIGNSIHRSERQALISEMRAKKPSVPIVFVTVFPDEHEPDADINVDVSKDFGKLLRVLQKITSNGAGGPGC